MSERSIHNPHMPAPSPFLPQLHETFGAQYVKYLFLVSSYRHPYRACVSAPRRLSKICPYNKGSSGYIGYLSLLLNAGAKVSQRLSPSPFHSCVPFAKWTQSCVFTIYNTTAAVLQPLFCNFVRIGICHKIEGIFLIFYANVSLQYELFGK